MCDSGEPFEVWTEEWRPLEEAAACHECERRIDPSEGPVWQADYNDWDGDRGTWICCPHCEELVEWLQRQCEGFTIGNVLEVVYEHVLDRDYMQDEEITLHFWLHLNVARLYAHACKQWRRPDGTLRPLPRLAFLHVPPSERAAARAAAGPHPTQGDIYP